MLEPVLNLLLDLIREHGPLLLFVAAFLEKRKPEWRGR